MRALTVRPGEKNSAALMDVSSPAEDDKTLLIDGLAIGVCGTDREIVAGDYGWAPPGSEYLILGHESLGHVVSAPANCGFSAGDLVVGFVRRPDPVPCPNCAVGEWDMCRNGQYTEHGIKELHGFCVEQYRLEPDRVVKLDPRLSGVGMLLEPTSVVAKAWDHIERIGRRALWQPSRVLVTGAGPIGLLAAMMGIQRGLQVTVLDIVSEGPKVDLVHALGASYVKGDIEQACHTADVIVECTGVAQLVFDAMQCSRPNGIVCLCGLSSGKFLLEADITSLNRGMVLENDVVFGSVNANRLHYEMAAAALAEADHAWLAKLITRRVRLSNWRAALEKMPDDVKTIIDITK